MVEDHRSVVRRSEIPGSISRPVVTPLYPSVVYRSTDADELDQQYEGHVAGYSYAREGHPNADVLAAKLAWLEGLGDNDPQGVVTGSGMAAVSAMMLGLLSHGDHIVAGNQLYGRTLRMLDNDLRRLGVDTSLVDVGDGAAVADAIGASTTMLLVEAVSNPTLRIADIEALAEVARDNDLLFAVDNTFTTPRMFRPFEHGADLVLHSVTKMLAGHADVTLGYVAARDEGVHQRVLDAAVTWGLTPSPFDCWLAERGLHTFELRYDQAERTATLLADALAAHHGVEAVIYPGRSDHPDNARSKALFDDRSGTMVSFRLRGDRAEVNAFIRAAEHISFAPTLGDVSTTISHPASSSHRRLTVPERTALGIDEGFIRVSVGIEDARLLVDELVAAVGLATSES